MCLTEDVVRLAEKEGLKLLRGEAATIAEAATLGLATNAEVVDLIWDCV